MKIHTGDTVAVITGKDKGKQGRVIRVLHDKNRLVIEGINMRVRHMKKTMQQAGQRVSFEASIHASNVMIVDPKTKKPTRIGYSIDAKTGAKKRIARRSGESIAKSAAVRASQTGSKTAAAAAAPAKTPKKKEEAAPAIPAKQPFWKRSKGGQGGTDGSVSDGPGGGGAASLPTAHRAQGG